MNMMCAIVHVNMMMKILSVYYVLSTCFEWDTVVSIFYVSYSTFQNPYKVNIIIIFCFTGDKTEV